MTARPSSTQRRAVYGEGSLSEGARTRGLECKLGHGRIVLPADEIDLLGEYAVGPRLPLSDRIECSIGVWSGEPILSVALTQHPIAPSRLAHGAVLIASGKGIRWALEVDTAVGLVEISKIAQGSAAMPWRRAATLSDQRSAQYIDIRRMIAALEGEGA